MSHFLQSPGSLYFSSSLILFGVSSFENPLRDVYFLVVQPQLRCYVYYQLHLSLSFLYKITTNHFFYRCFLLLYRNSNIKKIINFYQNMSEVIILDLEMYVIIYKLYKGKSTQEKVSCKSKSIIRETLLRL